MSCVFVISSSHSVHTSVLINSKDRTAADIRADRRNEASSRRLQIQNIQSTSETHWTTIVIMMIDTKNTWIVI